MHVRRRPIISHIFASLLLAFLCLINLACGKIWGGVNSPQFPGLTLSAQTITMTARSGSTWNFSASGGLPPYTYSLLSGPGSINSQTGLYTAGAIEGVGIIQVQDAKGNTFIGYANNMWNVVNGPIWAAAMDGSGNLYIGGGFTSIYPYSAPYALKLNGSTGTPSLDLDLQVGFDGFVNASVQLSDGSWIVVGGFSNYRGSPASGIAKLDKYGNLDKIFDAGGVGLGGAQAIVADGSGNIYVGGNFLSYQGSPAGRIAKLDTTYGNLDATFDPGGAGFTGGFHYVGCLALDGLGNLYVSGSFTTYRGSAANYIAKVDTTNGTLDATFDPAGTGFNAFSLVNSLVLDGAGNLYVGGAFSTYRGGAANAIVKMDTTNGTLNGVFDAGGAGFNGQVYALALDGAGNIYVGGVFGTYQGVAANAIAKLDTTNGNLNGVFDPGGAGFVFPSYGVTSLALDSSGNLYAGGDFTTYRGSTAGGIAKMDTTHGNLNGSFDPGGFGFSSKVNTLVLDSSGNLFAGGQFRSFGGTPASNIAKLDAGSLALDSVFDPGGIGVNTNGGVNSLILDGLGNLYIGGGFTTYRGSAASGIAKLDTTNGNLNGAFDPGGAGFTANIQVQALALDGAGNIYAGGGFTAYRGSAANAIAKMDTATGTLSGAFDPGGAGFGPAFAGVYTLAADGAGNIYAGGPFTTYRGSTANNIAKLDTATGTLNGVFDPAGTGFGVVGFSAVSTLALDGLGNLYVGGGFSNYRGAAAKDIAKLDTTNGTLNGVFDAGGAGFNFQPDSFALDGLGNIYIGGIFSSYQGSTTNCVVKLDTTNGTLNSAFNPGVGNGLCTAYSVLLDGAGDIYAFGFLITFQGSLSSSLIPLYTSTGAIHP